MAKIRATPTDPAPQRNIERACLPTQVAGDTYEAAINAQAMLVEPDAQWQWNRADIKILARNILGDMLIGAVPVITFREGEDVVEERVAKRLGLPAWKERRARSFASLDESARAKITVEELDEMARPADDRVFDEQPEWAGWEDEEETYQVLLHTRLGWVFGKAQAWSFALAKALAAYMELRRRADLTIAPIPQKPAFEFIDHVHRHHERPPGWYFGLGAWAVVNDMDTLIGVATVGRPSAAALQEQGAWEAQRMAVLEGGQNLCSALYAACWKEARRRGCKRLVTFILPTESGNSLRAAGWTLVKQAVEGKSGSWGRKGRPRKDKAPTCDKQRWEMHWLGPGVTAEGYKYDNRGIIRGSGPFGSLPRWVPAMVRAIGQNRGEPLRDGRQFVVFDLDDRREFPELAGYRAAAIGSGGGDKTTAELLTAKRLAELTRATVEETAD